MERTEYSGLFMGCTDFDMFCFSIWTYLLAQVDFGVLSFVNTCPIRIVRRGALRLNLFPPMGRTVVRKG